MAKGDKFLELTTYLEHSGEERLALSFSEIEKIIGFRLSDSAYKYPAQWSNSESQSFAFGWLNAGYLTRNVDIPNQKVEFIKSGIEVSKETNRDTIKIVKTINPTLPIDTAIENIKAYFGVTEIDKHGRYLSWRHCYNNFTKCRSQYNDDTVDYLCLHLAFYLASWGMLRGSSFLLQKDYKVHEPVVRIILEEKYNSLCGISAEELTEDENLDLIEEITLRIRRAYAEEMSSVEGVTNNATDTLVTKILLGTLGCVPAYDRYYIQAVKQHGISSGNYNKNSVLDVATYYLSHKDTFEKLRKEMSKCGTEYPPMKLMDMCLWQAGVDEES